MLEMIVDLFLIELVEMLRICDDLRLLLMSMTVAVTIVDFHEYIHDDDEMD